jgi:hypothetical protein
VDRPCIVCRSPIKDRHFSAKFCSHRCYSENKFKKRRKKKCKQCGIRFEVLRTHRGPYCSMKCAGDARNSRKTVKCRHCKRSYEVAKGGIRVSRFCSVACFHAAKKIVIVCAQCQTPFTAPKKASRKRNRKFCSYACSALYKRGSNHPNWRGGSQPRDLGEKSWKLRAEEIRKRDNYICQWPKCGVRWEKGMKKFPVHHIIPWRIAKLLRPGEENNSLNLVTVCGNCHGKALKAERALVAGDFLQYLAETDRAGFVERLVKDGYFLKF